MALPAHRRVACFSGDLVDNSLLVISEKLESEHTAVESDAMYRNAEQLCLGPRGEPLPIRSCDLDVKSLQALVRGPCPWCLQCVPARVL